jgi:hypothetical protein
LQQGEDEPNDRYSPGQSSARGWLARCLTVLCYFPPLIAAAALAQWGSHSSWWIFGLSWIIIQFVARVLGGWSAVSWVTGSQHLARDGVSVLRADTRAPVLYLRSFEMDERAGRNPSPRSYRTEEQQFKRVFRRVGPFVALGQPEERLPPAGAARIYAADTAWRAHVLELIRGAAVVLIVAGTSASLMWEIDQAAALVPPQRIVVLVPFGKDQYEHFRSQVTAQFGSLLPDWQQGDRRRNTGIRAAIYFEADWTARLTRLDTVDDSLEERCSRVLDAFFRQNGFSAPQPRRRPLMAMVARLY